jgi:hypothetical protein
MRRRSLRLGVLGLAAAAAWLPAAAREAKWINLTDGKTLKGWHESAQTGHSAASKHTSAGKWVVEKGAIVGSQDIPGNGGIILTDRRFGNFEVSLEMNNDYGPDSGLFLRSTEKGQCYQAMIDYHDNGNLMGIYGEGTGGFVSRNFITLATPDKIKEAAESAFKLPFPADDWPKIWTHGKWNRLRARITGNPPTIHTWINDRKIMEWTDTEKRLPDDGAIGLQVHGGGDFTKQYVRYRKVRVREL